MIYETPITHTPEHEACRAARLTAIRAVMKRHKMTGADLARYTNRTTGTVNSALRGNYPHYTGYHLPHYLLDELDRRGILAEADAMLAAQATPPVSPPYTTDAHEPDTYVGSHCFVHVYRDGRLVGQGERTGITPYGDPARPVYRLRPCWGETLPDELFVLAGGKFYDWPSWRDRHEPA